MWLLTLRISLLFSFTLIQYMQEGPHYDRCHSLIKLTGSMSLAHIPRQCAPAYNSNIPPRPGDPDVRNLFYPAAPTLFVLCFVFPTPKRRGYNWRDWGQRSQRGRQRIRLPLLPSLPLCLVPTAWPIRCRSWNCYLGHSAAKPDELGHCFDFTLAKASGKEQPAQKLARATQ